MDGDQVLMVILSTKNCDQSSHYSVTAQTMEDTDDLDSIRPANPFLGEWEIISGFHSALLRSNHAELLPCGQKQNRAEQDRQRLFNNGGSVSTLSIDCVFGTFICCIK